MDNPNNKKMSKRISRIETDIDALQSAVRQLNSTMAEMREGYAAREASALQKSRDEVYCANCFGGNPPDAELCIWCARPMSGFQQAQSIADKSLPQPIDEPILQPELEPDMDGIQYEPVAPTPETDVPTVLQPAPATAFRPNFDFLKSAEFWLNKVGIALLLLGLAFLFKYSIDQGWLTKEVRVALGLGLGAVLLGFGIAFQKERRHFSQVLLGGSVATYYLTGFAAYQLFHIVPYEVAFGFMAAVTVLAFVLSVRQDSAALSLVGAVGGLATPFILNTGEGGLSTLIAYTCLILSGTSAIYFIKGWRSLLWTSFVCCWAVFVIGYLNVIWRGLDSDKWAMQAGVIFSALAFWALPVLREVLRVKYPQRWPRPALDKLGDIEAAVNAHVHVLAVLVPLMSLALSWAIWSSQDVDWGWITAGAAIVYGLAYTLLRSTEQKLAYTHAMASIMLLTLAIIEAFVSWQSVGHWQDMLLVTLAVEAAALHFIAHKLSDRGTSVYGHLIFGGLAYWLTVRLMAPVVNPLNRDMMVILNPEALALLTVTALAMAVSFVVRPKDMAILYRNAAHLVFAALIWRELWTLPDGNGEAYVMLVWAAYATLLNFAYRRFPRYFTLYDATLPALVMFGGVAAIFAHRLWTGHVGDVAVMQADLAIINMKTLIDAVVLVLAAECAYEVRPKELTYFYRLAAHAGVLALLWRELSTINPNGTDYIMLAWAAYAALWQFVARRTEDRITFDAMHIPFVGVGLLFLYGIATGHEGEMAVFNVKAMAGAAVIALALYVSTLIKTREVTLAYRLLTHAGVLALLWREFYALRYMSAFNNGNIVNDGNAYVTISWGVYALALLAAGVYFVREGRGRAMLYVAIATLFLVVGKLFLIDLIMLEEIWRILLFLGFGAIFLGLSYFFQNLLRPTPKHPID